MGCGLLMFVVLAAVEALSLVLGDRYCDMTPQELIGTWHADDGATIVFRGDHTVSVSDLPSQYAPIAGIRTGADSRLNLTGTWELTTPSRGSGNPPLTLHWDRQPSSSEGEDVFVVEHSIFAWLITEKHFAFDEGQVDRASHRFNRVG